MHRLSTAYISSPSFVVKIARTIAVPPLEPETFVRNCTGCQLVLVILMA